MEAREILFSQMELLKVKTILHSVYCVIDSVSLVEQTIFSASQLNVSAKSVPKYILTTWITMVLLIISSLKFANLKPITIFTAS